MGTPAVISFTGHDGYNSPNTLHLYKHYDGDPVEVLRDLATVVVDATGEADAYRAENPHIAERVKVLPATLYGLYIGETTGPMGLSVAPMTAQGAGNSYGEYRYIFDTDAKTVEVQDEDENRIDPYIYIERLHEEYQGAHRLALDASLGALAGFGWTSLSPAG